MEIKDALKDDVFHTTVVTFVPGTIAVAPFLSVMLIKFPKLVTICQTSAVLSAVTLLCL